VRGESRVVTHPRPTRPPPPCSGPVPRVAGPSPRARVRVPGTVPAPCRPRTPARPDGSGGRQCRPATPGPPHGEHRVVPKASISVPSVGRFVQALPGHPGCGCRLRPAPGFGRADCSGGHRTRLTRFPTSQGPDLPATWPPGAPPRRTRAGSLDRRASSATATATRSGSASGRRRRRRRRRRRSGGGRPRTAVAPGRTCRSSPARPPRTGGLGAGVRIGIPAGRGPAGAPGVPGEWTRRGVPPGGSGIVRAAAGGTPERGRRKERAPYGPVRCRGAPTPDDPLRGARGEVSPRARPAGPRDRRCATRRERRRARR
jgi:hypothetical protein